MSRYNEHIADQVALFNNPARLRVPAFSVIDALQRASRRPGEQILATAVALIAMCESANLNFNDVVAKAIRVMADVEGPFTGQLQAVRAYAANELRKGII